MIAKEIRDFRAMSESRARVEKQNTNFSVAMRLGVTPVPIPNTMVKTQAADGTALETVWESRWLPNLKRKKAKRFLYRYRHNKMEQRKGFAKESLCQPNQQGSAVMITGFTSD